MAALDFPSSPTNGQTYTANGSTWTYNSATTSWLANNAVTVGPSFHAYVGATTTSVPNNTFTKIGLNTELFDTDNCFDSTTNFRFTPTVPGYYQFNGSITLPSAMSGLMQLSIYKNGSEALRLNQSQSTWWTLSGSGILQMNGTTDYVELFLFHLNGVAISIGNLGSPMNYMSGHFVRS